MPGQAPGWLLGTFRRCPNLPSGHFPTVRHHRLSSPWASVSSSVKWDIAGINITVEMKMLHRKL